MEQRIEFALEAIKVETFRRCARNTILGRIDPLSASLERIDCCAYDTKDHFKTAA